MTDKEIKDSQDLFYNIDLIKTLQGNLCRRLESTTLLVFVPLWASQLEEGTKDKYEKSVDLLVDRKIISWSTTIGTFNIFNHGQMLAYIKSIADLSEATKQVMASAYISLTTYLEKITDGWFKRTHALKDTFPRFRAKIATRTLTLEEWHKFSSALYQQNIRDSFIARCMLYGGHRAAAILKMTVEQVDYTKNIIRFPKVSGLEKPILYPASFMEELGVYMQLHSRHKYVFVTRNRKPLTRSRLNYSFKHASDSAGMPIVTPEILRATWSKLNKERKVEGNILKIIV